MKKKMFLILSITICFIFVMAIGIKFKKTSKDLIKHNQDEYFKLDQTTMVEKENKEYKDYKDKYPDMYVVSTKKIEEDTSKVAYLTFDDGPSKYTKDILKELEEYDIKATFFILGSTMTKEGEENLKGMADAGHTIGIHTYSHNRKSIYCSVEAFMEDFYTVYKQIFDITGIKARIYRFPWGSVNSYCKGIKDELVEELVRRGFDYYDWNVTAEDSVGNPTKYSITSNVLDNYKKYSKPVILMHDSSINKLTVDTLPKIIEEIKKNGYEFDTLENRIPYHFR